MDVQRHSRQNPRRAPAAATVGRCYGGDRRFFLIMPHTRATRNDRSGALHTPANGGAVSKRGLCRCSRWMQGRGGLAMHVSRHAAHKAAGPLAAPDCSCPCWRERST
nr:hypothetical protein [Pandoravirus massiliensis]